MRTKQSFRCGMWMVILAALPGLAQIQNTQFEASVSVGITETVGGVPVPLQGTTAGGDLLQLIYVGPDGLIAAPDPSSGSPTIDDVVLGVSYIGFGVPFNANEGKFAVTFQNNSLLTPGTMVYMRAWNEPAPVSGQASFGDSQRYLLVDSNNDGFLEMHDFNVEGQQTPWRVNLKLDGSPVELALFTARDESGYVALSWATYSETDNLGFHLYRSVSADSSKTRLNERLIDGAINSQSFHEYSFKDRSVEENHKYYYWLSDVSVKGLETMHGPRVLITQNLPDNFVLEQNYPNPFNPTTSIPYMVRETGQVRIQIYNIRGQLVRDLVNAVLAVGRYNVSWDGHDMNNLPVPTGTYLCTMEANNFRSFIKMTLAK